MGVLCGYDNTTKREKQSSLVSVWIYFELKGQTKTNRLYNGIEGFTMIHNTHQHLLFSAAAIFLLN